MVTVFPNGSDAVVGASATSAAFAWSSGGWRHQAAVTASFTGAAPSRAIPALRWSPNITALDAIKAAGQRMARGGDTARARTEYTLGVKRL